jgi:pyrophosphatase PpaX
MRGCEPVLFDLDGTVLDTVTLILQSHRHAVRTVLGKELSDEELVSQVGRPLMEQMQVFSPDRAEELFTVYRTWNHANTKRLIATYDGINELLDALAADGRTLGLVTSKSRDAVDLAFDSVPGIGERFSVVLSSDDTALHKPSPEPILRALELLGSDGTGGACYVGDAPFDLQSAKAAGVKAIAVTWGFFDRAALEAENPDVICETPAELLEAIRR